MNKIYPHLINFFSAVLLFIFIFIVVTENTGFINNNYKASIISTLEEELEGSLNQLQIKLLEIFSLEVNNGKRVEESWIIKKLIIDGKMDINNFKEFISTRRVQT